MAKAQLFAIPFSHPFVHKSALPKTAVDDTPGASLLGLTTTLGAKLIGNAASANQKTDVAGFLVVVPATWIQGSDIYIRARAKQATTLLTLGTVVSITAKLQGDDAVGADIASLGSAASRTLTTSLANYDMKILGASLRRGDHIWCTLVLDANDTGGAVNTAAQCTRLWALVSVES